MAESLAKKLSVWRNIVLVAYVVVIILYIAGIAAFLQSRQLGINIITATTFLYVFAARKLDKQYNSNFVQANLGVVYQDKLDEMLVLQKTSMDIQAFTACGLIPVREKGGLASGWTVTGKKHEDTVRLSNLIICFDQTDPQSRHKVGLLNGVWLGIDYAYPRDGHIFVLISSDIFTKGITQDFYTNQRLQPLVLPAPNLSKKFCLYGEKDSDRYEAESFLQKYQELLQKLGDNSATILALRSDSARTCAFINGKSLDFDTPLRGKITPDIVAWDRLPELSGVLINY